MFTEARGLEHLHTRHILYRDLKPENLILDSKGQGMPWGFEGMAWREHDVYKNKCSFARGLQTGSKFGEPMWTEHGDVGVVFGWCLTGHNWKLTGFDYQNGCPEGLFIQDSFLAAAY